MEYMTKKKQPSDRHKNKALQLRLSPQIRAQLERLAREDDTTLTAVVRSLIIRYLKEHGYWPPKDSP